MRVSSLMGMGRSEMHSEISDILLIKFTMSRCSFGPVLQVYMLLDQLGMVMVVVLSTVLSTITQLPSYYQGFSPIAPLLLHLQRRCARVEKAPVIRTGSSHIHVYRTRVAKGKYHRYTHGHYTLE